MDLGDDNNEHILANLIAKDAFKNMVVAITLRFVFVLN